MFPIPDTLIGRIPRLRGIDGQAKMSKTLGNVIELRSDVETVRQRVMSMFTDPTRIHATDPGHVDGNPLFEYHDAFNPDIASATVSLVSRWYRAAEYSRAIRSAAGTPLPAPSATLTALRCESKGSIKRMKKKQMKSSK